jgi:acyl carrier protein
VVSSDLAESACALTARVLGVPEVEPMMNLLDLGATSVQLVRLAVQAEQELGIQVVHKDAAAEGRTLTLHGGSYGSFGGLFSTNLPLGDNWSSRLTMDGERLGFRDERTDYRRGHALWRVGTKPVNDQRFWFNADVNWDHTSSYTTYCSLCTEVPGWPAIADSFSWLTASAHYRIYKGLEVYVEGKNLTNAIARTYLNGNPLLPWGPGQLVGNQHAEQEQKEADPAEQQPGSADAVPQDRGRHERADHGGAARQPLHRHEHLLAPWSLG